MYRNGERAGLLILLVWKSILALFLRGSCLMAEPSASDCLGPFMFTKHWERLRGNGAGVWLISVESRSTATLAASVFFAGIEAFRGRWNGEDVIEIEEFNDGAKANGAASNLMVLQRIQMV
jgi:hypothetical protein